jgi:hypothetical protein
MGITRDPETGEYIVTNLATGEEVGRFPTGSLTQAQALDAQVNGPANEGDEEGEDSGVPIAGQTGPSLPLELRPRLRAWNDEAKKQGLPTISGEDAADARAWEYVGFTFEESLNAYSRWMRSEAGVPAPTGEAIKAWIDETNAREIPYYVAAPTPPTGLPAGAEQTEVGQAILGVTDDPAVQAAMWAGAGNEGGQQGPWGTQPGGNHVGGAGEVGPWQIHPIHFQNIAPEAAADPNSAALYMLPRYQDAVKSVPAEVWQSDPGGALTLAIANAERPQGWHEGLTVEEAVSIYGGRPDTGPIAPGATTPGTIRTMPTGETTRSRTLSAAEENDYTLNYAPYGVSRENYVAARDMGLDPFAVQARNDYIELNRDLEEGLITGEDFALALEAMQQYHLTAAQIRTAQQLDIPFDEYGKTIAGGYTDEDVRTATQLGIPLSEYQWARGEGVSNEQIREGKRTGVPLAQTVFEVRLADTQERMDTEFTAAWNKLVGSIDPNVLATKGMAGWLEWKQNQLYQEYVTARTQQERQRIGAELKTSLSQTVGGPFLGQEISVPSVEPLKLPTAEELVVEGVNKGVVTRFVRTGEPPLSEARRTGIDTGGASFGTPFAITRPLAPSHGYFTGAGAQAFSREVSTAFLKREGALPESVRDPRYAEHAAARPDLVTPTPKSEFKFELPQAQETKSYPAPPKKRRKPIVIT